MPFSFVTVMRIEKAGRKGKTVTLLEKLPRSYPYLEELAKLLKMRCGSGGTYRIEPEGGVIEIQGDKRELLRKILAEKNIQYKG